METGFEWDPAKDAENRRKHDVTFFEAQLAFLDSYRVIAEDLGHGGTERRFCCFGRVSRGILTVCFIFFVGTPFGFLAPAIGAGAGGPMRHRQKYSNEPLGRLKIVADFLPPPERLVIREDGVKVTLSLSRRSVDFFKAHAARSKVPYQKMIRTLLDSYACKHAAE
jgi:uncharacterized DUF497 family protein